MAENIKSGSKLPRHITGILSRLTDAGFSAYAVGGCVRDMLIGRRPCDWDVATDADCVSVMDIFPKSVPTGIKYGTVTVFYGGGKAEVTTFRSDGDYSDGRRPDTVSFLADIEGDLSRRDFTVNAMAMSIDGTLTDPFGGREDLKNGVIRCVGDPEKRFSEDALRMLRAIRFSAQLGFRIDAKTQSAIASCAELSEKLSPERVRAETEKILASPMPESVKKLADMKLLANFMQESDKKSTQSFENLRKLPRKGDFRMCAFVSALCEDGYISDAEKFLRSLRCSSKTVKACAEAVSLSHSLPTDEKGTRIFLAEHGTETGLLTAAAVICRKPGEYRRVQRVIRGGGIVSVSDLDIDGEELKKCGIFGENVGKTLRELSRKVTAGELENQRTELINAVKKER